MLNFPNLEQEILKYWQEHDIFKKTLAKHSATGEFVFYEGPPTANGKPGIHHVLARAFKDLIPRFKTMQGFLVERKAGWDTHGLPVELQVEKEIQKEEIADLKIKWQETGEGINEEAYLQASDKLKTTKDIIAKYGIEKFNQRCRESVWQYQEEWEKLTERIGFWLDMENPYITYSNDYIESLWWIFKQINEKGLLYQGYKVVPHCPRCGTALSSHEVAQGYKEVTEPSVYIKFKVTKGNGVVNEGDYILSWTTTPWTLPGNVALAIGGKIDYVKVFLNGENLIIAESLKDLIKGEVKEKFKGKDLVGVEYEPLFPNAIPASTENYQNAFKVYPADFVTTEDGTGVVHTAVMYGEDDYNLGTAVGLPKFHTVDESGNFIADIADLKGKFVKDKAVEAIIIKYLQANNQFFSQVDYTHDYPFCWRCGTPLLYYAKNSWFIKMSALSKKLTRENQKINWVPEHIKEGRFGEWLSGVKDWAISRERYWGTPIPIWQCTECNEIKVIGSYSELAESCNSKKPLAQDFDPHKPFIDEYKITCKCGQQMNRIKEVADCWFDSGSMPLAQHHYPFENKEKVDSKDYYPADFISEAIDQTRGWFYTLLAIGVLLDKGAPYKNVICLGLINDAKGQKMSKSKGNIVDPWEVINQWGADALRFHLYTVNQPGESKNFDIKNVEEIVKKNFLILFNVLTFYKTYAPNDAINSGEAPKTKNILDQWIIARLNQLISGVTKNLEEYNVFTAGRSITDFITDLSTWYLRRSRDRFKADDLKDKEAALNTLGFVLLNVAKIMAPFTPFIAEQLYRQLCNKQISVHLEDWPTAGKVDAKVLASMETVRKIVELALAKRDEAGIKVRQVLAKLTVAGAELTEEFSALIKDEVNVKEVVYNKAENLTVELDTVLTDDLKQEGLYRELVRTINQLRKEALLTINDKVEIYYQTSAEPIIIAINKFETELLKNTISTKISAGEAEGIITKEMDVNGEKVKVTLKK